MNLAIPIILLALGMAGGLALAAWAALLFLRGQRTRSWPAVEGTVNRAWVLQKGSNVGRDNSDRRGRAVYFAEVEYGYAIGGKAMRGDRIAMGVVPSRTRSETEAEVAKWPENAKVNVYYDPADPAASVLVPGPNWRAVVRLAMAGAFLLGLFGFLISKWLESGLMDQ